MHQTSMDHCRIFVEERLLSLGPLRIADVGAQDVNGSYRKLFDREGWEYVGFDESHGKNVDVVLTPETLAANRDLFDVVISGQTLEHTLKPWVWIREVASLAKPGGLIWIIAPNTWMFHEFPRDCWRVFPDGLRALFDEAGLKTLYSRMVGADTFGLACKHFERGD